MDKQITSLGAGSPVRTDEELEALLRSRELDSQQHLKWADVKNTLDSE